MRIFRAVDGFGLARVDFFLEEGTNEGSCSAASRSPLISSPRESALETPQEEPALAGLIPGGTGQKARCLRPMRA